MVLEKKHLYIIGGALIIIFFLFIFALGEDAEVSETVEQNKIKKEVVFKEKKVLEKVDLKKFTLKPSKVSVPQNKSSYKIDDGSMPMKMDKIVELISQNNFEKAEELILELEKTASQTDMMWLIYYKAEIYYFSGDYSFAKIFYKEFIKRYPNHIMAGEAKKALRYIHVRRFQ